jgi:hypothetical protein
MYTGPLFRVIPCPVCGCRVFQFKNSEPLLDLWIRTGERIEVFYKEHVCKGNEHESK